MYIYKYQKLFITHCQSTQLLLKRIVIKNVVQQKYFKTLVKKNKK